MINKMDKEQQKLFMKWSTAIAESIQDLHKGIQELSDIVFRQAQRNQDMHGQMIDILIKMSDETGLLSKTELQTLETMKREKESKKNGKDGNGISRQS
tara:strand:+ start:6886 stop:7179 length:294 start_codon:yes stop_codon:yes gene_type:complete